MKNTVYTIAKITLVLTYLVIIAGAVVRMTGSGMGCPDWPKCFGYFIPPTQESQLQWKPNYTYKKGNVIIVDQTLQVAKNNFTTTSTFSKKNWNTYTKHDYATFNASHTWVEYINRLFGALAGLATLALAIASFWYWKKNKSVTIISWLVVLAMGFQAWLGKTVVDSNLTPYKITIHMIMALVIVAMLLYIVFTTNPKKIKYSISKSFQLLLLVVVIATFIQIILGTQVRQFIDIQIKNLGVSQQHLWLEHPTFIYYVHRSFSILILALNGYLLFVNTKKNYSLFKLKWSMYLLVFIVLTGITMQHFNFPFGSQTLHLVFASILFGVQFYLILEAFYTKNTLQSS